MVILHIFSQKKESELFLGHRKIDPINVASNLHHMSTFRVLLCCSNHISAFVFLHFVLFKSFVLIISFNDLLNKIDFNENF